MNQTKAVAIATQFMNESMINHLGVKAAFFASSESYRREGIPRNDAWVVHFQVPLPKAVEDGEIILLSSDPSLVIVSIDAETGVATFLSLL